jgi:hypothetical protein
MASAAVSQSNEDKLKRLPASLGIPEFQVTGAEINRYMQGTSHFTVVDRDMLTYKEVMWVGNGPPRIEYEVEHHNPSPVWQEIRQEIQALSSSG